VFQGVADDSGKVDVFGDEVGWLWWVVLVMMVVMVFPVMTMAITTVVRGIPICGGALAREEGRKRG